MSPEPAETAKPRTKQFRRRFDMPRLTPDSAARQGKVATLAWERLRESAAVVAFLNTYDELLDARPIDLATSSDAGMSRVVAHLNAVHPAP